MTPETKERLTLKELRICARLRQRHELMIVRPMLEDLVRAAYPMLADKCLCSRCLFEELHRGADRVEC